MTMSCGNITLPDDSETRTLIIFPESQSARNLCSTSTHPSVSPKSVFELTGVFHRLFHRHDNFIVIITVKKQE